MTSISSSKNYTPRFHSANLSRQGEKKNNGVLVFIHKNQPGNELQWEKGQEKKKKGRKEKKERGGEELELEAIGHLVLCLKSLVKTEEHISSKQVRLPVPCSLDEERICIEAI